MKFLGACNHARIHDTDEHKLSSDRIYSSVLLIFKQCHLTAVAMSPQVPRSAMQVRMQTCDNITAC